MRSNNIRIYSVVGDEKGNFNKLEIGDESIYFQTMEGQVVESKDLSDEKITLIQNCLKIKQNHYHEIFNLLLEKYNLKLGIGEIQELHDALELKPEV